MLKKEIEKNVREILGEYATLTKDISEIEESDYLEDYGMNSAGILRLIVAIEKKYNIVFTDESFDLRYFSTIEKIVEHVSSLINEKE